MKKMNWSSLLVEERFESVSKKAEDQRSQFQKDIDRITFSNSFRRLGRKTQVHPLNENDHIHTRLSHSLEVACVGRSLGVLVGNFLQKENELPKNVSPLSLGEIVHAACLAHDIGNPPFGHAGEEVIKKWFQEAFENSNSLKGKIVKKDREKDFTCFDGNAMAFRVVTFKEYYTGKGGMRLTYPTLGAMLKYPWTSHYALPKSKFSCFQSEFESLLIVANKLELVEKECHKEEYKCQYARHPLAFLVEAADDICYRILDIEDAVELGILRPHFIDEQFRGLLNLKEYEKELLDSKITGSRTKNALLRGKTMEIIISDVCDTFIKNYSSIMSGEYNSALTENKEKESCCKLNEAYDVVKKVVYSSRRKTILEIGAFSALENLLSTFIEAAIQVCYTENSRRSYKAQKILELLDSNFFINSKDTDFNNIKECDPNSLYPALMLILDYITGMTDHYATQINKQILGLGI